jgi:hypothetical protein
VKVTKQHVAEFQEACIEPSYQVIEPDNTDAMNGMWGVMDAECVFVAYCQTELLAKVTATALEGHDDACWARMAEDAG